MIHPVTPRDLWALRRKPFRKLFLFDETMLARGHNPALFAARCALPVANSGCVTLVYRDGGLRGFLQARRRHNRPEVDLVYLAALPYSRRAPRPTDPDVWYRLLERLIVQAGNRNVERIYAPLAATSPDEELFRQLGFQPYAQREVWMMRQPAIEEGSAMVVLRHQVRRDAFAINQLYESLAPRVVQLAEMRTSAAWQLPISRRMGRIRRKGWVLGAERGEGLDVAIQAWIGASTTVLYPLIRPEARHNAGAILRYSLSQISHKQPVYALVPGYQGELGSALQELGFEHMGDQVLMVKSTVSKIRMPLRAAVIEGGPDRVVAPSTVGIRRCAEPAPLGACEHGRP